MKKEKEIKTVVMNIIIVKERIGKTYNKKSN